MSEELRPLRPASKEEQEKKRAQLERREHRYERGFLADLDPLTELPNRRAFEEHMSKELRNLEQTRREGDPSRRTGWVMIGDVDKFKAINDIYGHPVGDAVLRGVARVLQQKIRGTDIVARWGGEEFIILLIDGENIRIEERAEDLRGAVEALEISDAEGKHIPVTMSFGVSEVADESDSHGAIERADKALYRAKHAGRNRVALADL